MSARPSRKQGSPTCSNNETALPIDDAATAGKSANHHSLEGAAHRLRCAPSHAQRLRAQPGRSAHRGSRDSSSTAGAGEAKTHAQWRHHRVSRPHGLAHTALRTVGREDSSRRRAADHTAGATIKAVGGRSRACGRRPYLWPAPRPHSRGFRRTCWVAAGCRAVSASRREQRSSEACGPRRLGPLCAPPPRTAAPTRASRPAR